MKHARTASHLAGLLGLVICLLAVLPTATRAADEVQLEGYSMVTNPAAIDTATAIAVFGNVAIADEETVLQLPCIFTGDATQNALQVEFISGLETITLTQLSGLSSLPQNELGFLVFEATAIAGKTGSLRVTLANQGGETGAGSELFLVDINASRATSPAAFELQSISAAEPTVPAANESSDQTWLGSLGLSIALSLITLFWRRRRN